MRDINRVMLLGRLGNDPILRFTKNGTPVSQFSLATETWHRSRNESETTWHRIVTWGKPAEKVNEELKKGMAVFLEGGIRVRKYEDQEGEIHYIHEIHADRVNFLHKKTKYKENAEAVAEDSVVTIEEAPN
ncbi:MAG: single-stranded DNA-binding protein [Bdellovibrionales bacterium]|nr:single-stranded DNA-binding protein [Bdellovibrionales bacterium]